MDEKSSRSGREDEPTLNTCQETLTEGIYKLVLLALT